MQQKKEYVSLTFWSISALLLIGEIKTWFPDFFKFNFKKLRSINTDLENKYFLIMKNLPKINDELMVYNF